MSLRSHLRIFFLSSGLLLAACGPVKHINSPAASIQQLSVLTNGRWQLDIRLQNFSDVGMHYATLNAHLDVEGVSAGEIEIKLDMDIPGESADIVSAAITPNAKAYELLAGDRPHDFSYAIKGHIILSEPKRDFELDHKSRLSPVPGLSNIYR